MFVAVSLLLATVCLLTAAGKLLGHPKMRQSAAHFGIPWRKYQLIGQPSWPPPQGYCSACAGIRSAWPRRPG